MVGGRFSHILKSPAQGVGTLRYMAPEVLNSGGGSQWVIVVIAIPKCDGGSQFKQPPFIKCAVARGEYGVSADVFSFGILLHEMLSGGH